MDQIHNLGVWEQRVFEHMVGRKHVAKNTNVVFEEQSTFGQRMADTVAAFGGSWPFIFLFLAGMFLWILFNMERGRPFDPYPFILLNLILSCLAALQAPVIMMSQNRQAAKDRLNAQHDYEVNLKAEMEIMALHTKLDELREQHLIELKDAVVQHLQLLEKIEANLSERPSSGSAS